MIRHSVWLNLGYLGSGVGVGEPAARWRRGALVASQDGEWETKIGGGCAPQKILYAGYNPLFMFESLYRAVRLSPRICS